MGGSGATADGFVFPDGRYFFFTASSSAFNYEALDGTKGLYQVGRGVAMAFMSPGPNPMGYVLSHLDKPSQLAIYGANRIENPQASPNVQLSWKDVTINDSEPLALSNMESNMPKCGEVLFKSGL